MHRVLTTAVCLSLLAQRPQASAAATATDPIATDFAALAGALSSISERLYYRARLDDALRLLDANLAAAPADLPHDVRAQLLYQRARTVYYASSLAGTGYDAAVQALDDAWRAAEPSCDRHLQADVLDLIGLCRYSMEFGRGDYAASRTYYERAYAIRKEIADRRGLAESLFHFGLLHQNKENPTKADETLAREYYLESLRIAEEDHLLLEQSYAVRHLAAFESEAGNLETALELFQRSLALRQEIGFEIYLSPAFIAVGDVLLEMKRYDEAIATYRQALDSARATDATRFAVDAHLAIGEAHERQGRQSDARLAYQSALAHAKERAYAAGTKRAEEKLKTSTEPSSR